MAIKLLSIIITPKAMDGEQRWFYPPYKADYNPFKTIFTPHQVTKKGNLNPNPKPNPKQRKSSDGLLSL
jgi:hypothetical protein